MASTSNIKNNLTISLEKVKNSFQNIIYHTTCQIIKSKIYMSILDFLETQLCKNS